MVQNFYPWKNKSFHISTKLIKLRKWTKQKNTPFLSIGLRYSRYNKLLYHHQFINVENNKTDQIDNQNINQFIWEISQLLVDFVNFWSIKDYIK